MFAYSLEGVVAGSGDLLEDRPHARHRLLAGAVLAADERRRCLGLHAGGLRHVVAHDSELVYSSHVADLPLATSLRFVFVDDNGPEIYLPWQMIFYLSAGVLAGVVAELGNGQAESIPPGAILLADTHTGDSRRKTRASLHVASRSQAAQGA